MTKYRCNECGNVFDEDEFKRVRYIGGETEDFCPFCDNDDFEEVEQCDDCGEWFSPNELYGCLHSLYCEECLESYATVETALEVGRDNPVEISGFFEQIFTVEQMEKILMDKAEELHGKGLAQDAINYCIEDPDYFANWWIDHGKEVQRWQEKTRLSTG